MPNSVTVCQIESDPLAKEVANMWMRWNMARKSWLDATKELRQYLFATDTRHTSNSKLPWKNKTTVPKLTHIRDNLYANYMAASIQDKNELQERIFDAIYLAFGLRRLYKRTIYYGKIERLVKQRKSLHLTKGSQY